MTKRLDDMKINKRGQPLTDRVKMRGGGIAKRGMGIALRGGGIANRGMGIALRGGGRAALRFGSGRRNLLEEEGRIDARRHPDAADRAEKRRVISELNRGYKKGGRVAAKQGYFAREDESIGMRLGKGKATAQHPQKAKKERDLSYGKWGHRGRDWKKSGGRIGLKEGSDKNWIQKATKTMDKSKPCTGKKFGSKTCPPGSRRYNLAKTFKKMGRERKAKNA